MGINNALKRESPVKEDKTVSAKDWYWIILIIAIIFGGIGSFRDEVWWNRGFNLILVILLILIGFIIAGSPIK